MSYMQRVSKNCKEKDKCPTEKWKWDMNQSLWEKTQIANKMLTLIISWENAN